MTKTTARRATTMTRRDNGDIVARVLSTECEHDSKLYVRDERIMRMTFPCPQMQLGDRVDALCMDPGVVPGLDQ